jgi:agmatine/peptidylarginine deiminase
MEKELHSYAKALDLKLTALPLPAPIRDKRGGRLPATYANFVILNHNVLMPTYDDPMDDIAKGRLQSCFPERQVVGIKSLKLLQQGGSLHCATMNIPAD